MMNQYVTPVRDPGKCDDEPVDMKNKPKQINHN